jgi:hypothetical protein
MLEQTPLVLVLMNTCTFEDKCLLESLNKDVLSVLRRRHPTSWEALARAASSRWVRSCCIRCAFLIYLTTCNIHTSLLHRHLIIAMLYCCRECPVWLRGRRHSGATSRFCADQHKSAGRICQRQQQCCRPWRCVWQDICSWLNNLPAHTLQRGAPSVPPHIPSAMAAGGSGKPCAQRVSKSETAMPDEQTACHA